MITQINFQPMLKIERTDGKQLLVHSLFFTIQGEGPNVGKPSVFVRLAGCNLQCPGCDTEYTAGAVLEDIASICTRIRMAFGSYPGERLVVITGGEPFRQNILPLIGALIKNREFHVQVESNGTAGFMEDEYRTFDHIPFSLVDPNSTRNSFEIVVSPKAGKVHESLWPFITAYKYVVDIAHVDGKDGLPTSVLGMPGKPARPHPGFKGDVYIQPMDERFQIDNQFNLEACVELAKRFGYRVGIQTHKLMGVE